MGAHQLTAILLAAGRGKRLGLDGPKCLVEIAGTTLLERHLTHLSAVGVGRVIVVTGHAADEIDGALAEIAGRGVARSVDIATRFNERFVHGSIVSLQCAVGELLAAGGLWMDADVLYPAELLQRLVQSEQPNVVLLDGRSSEQGEEMMLAVKAGRVHRIARSVGTDWDLVGESVGFFKCDPAGATVMKRILDAEIDAGRLDQEHEDGLTLALNEVVFGFERVDEFAWTEIDFPEDLDQAAAIAREID
ncbi:MAG: phosphocholine cytidylyltransferase family protein [Deltaproteobacteria bacterium]|nr:phosphocholine cytidylyltransferase family protein [Deltaproteobacteria bacterium]